MQSREHEPGIAGERRRAGRRRLGRILAAAGAVAFAGLPAAPEAHATAAEWEVEVARPGLVRIPWPSDAPVAGGVEVRGPQGAAVPSRVVSLAAGQRRSARVSSVRAVAGGWELVVDAGPAPPRHQGVRLPLAEAGAASLTVEASDDGREWRPLAAATLFRLGSEAGLQQGAVQYPATEARWLRLLWPADAGFPELRDVELEVVASPEHRLPVEPAPCATRHASHTRCLVPAPDRPLRGLEVTLAAGEAAGWRLYRGQAGAWVEVGEGTWTATTGTPARRLRVTGSPAPLLLELWGAAAAPRPTALALLAEPLAIELDATAAGLHRIVAGGSGPTPPVDPATAAEAAWLPPVPRGGAAPAATPAALPAGAALPDAPFASSWPLAAEAAAGEVVRLELQPAVLAAAAPGLRDLRLAAGGRQVPYVLATAAAPAQVAAWSDLAAAPREGGTSVFELPLAAAPGTAADAQALVLRTAARPLLREVRLRRLGAPAAGVAATPTAPTAWTRWECRPLAPLPCELWLYVPAGPAAALQVEVADGDDAPLADLAAELWRPQQELRFRWPGEPVTLLAGSPGLAAPRYELAALESHGLELAAVTATLGEASEGPGGPLGRWPRWAVFTALAAAAATLLLVLVRALRSPETGQPS